VPLETTIAPRPPYSLALSARMRSDTTRRLRDGVLTVALEAGDHAALARVHQRPDGTLAVRIEGERPEAALTKLRFVLAVDDDHEPFLRRFVDDPLIGRAVRRLRGLRPLRTATVTHALLKAVCGQLIQARAARDLEARLLRRSATPCGDLLLPPTRATFGGSSPSHLAREGLVSRKANALVRLSREWDVERLHGVETQAAVARIERERGLGPWSAGVVCLQGLGRYEHGLVGDLGLIKLCSALLGRRAEAEDTRRLLEPYGEWAGLASVYLLARAGRDWRNVARRRGAMVVPRQGRRERS
jgi:3-methyladenine DNA glycosylase/8-oxoguanine DNA glycosylase